MSRASAGPLIYVASSWRNPHQPGVVRVLRDAGFAVYDFRHPTPGDHGFHWSEIDPEWRCWNAERYVRALEHPLAEAGFRSDMSALLRAAAVVLVLPSGRSAHLEAGWAAGQGKPVYVFCPEPRVEPELMVKMLRGGYHAILGNVVAALRRDLASLVSCGPCRWPQQGEAPENRHRSNANPPE